MVRSLGPPLWRTPNGTRIDSLDETIIDLIVRSNCVEITLALEHGDKDMLKIMNKKLNIDKAYSVIEILVRKGLRVVLFIIVGYPGETKERFESGYRFLKRIKDLGNGSGYSELCATLPRHKTAKKMRS